MAVKTRDHGEAREAAFGRFGLQDDGRGAPPGEREWEAEAHGDFPIKRGR